MKLASIALIVFNPKSDNKRVFFLRTLTSLKAAGALDFFISEYYTLCPASYSIYFCISIIFYDTVGHFYLPLIAANSLSA